MTLDTALWTALLALLPISELRGAIPFAVAGGIPWYFAYPFAAAVNSLAAPLCWLFLSSLHKVFLKLAERPFFGWYRKLFERFVERARLKLRKNLEKWGWLGLALFVAVPLPVTGAWTGTLGAWVLGLSKKRTLAAVITGVVIAGAIVTAVTILGIGALGLFTKNPGGLINN
jgi:uncharacterized membrane protein